MEEYKGYRIRKSGRHYFKAIPLSDARPIFARYSSIAAVKAVIDSAGRVMTFEEYAIVHPNNTYTTPSNEQWDSAGRLAR